LLGGDKINIKQKMSIALISIILLSTTGLAVSTSDANSKAPVASFSAKPLSGTLPLKVVFTDKSTGKPTSWKWSFGDGTNSPMENPTHNYSKIGKFNVSLTVTNANGNNTKTLKNYITVTAPLKAPTAAFSVTNDPKKPLTVKCIDKSTGSPTSWSWNFGDKTKISTIKNVTHTYKKSGKYTITLTVKNSKGSNKAVKTINIK
jgi:PKD repeat protein